MNSQDSEPQFPIKKLHRLENKDFVVIDESIIKKLLNSGRDISDLYFQQELTEDHLIILRLFEMKSLSTSKSE